MICCPSNDMKSGNPFPLLYVPQRMGNTLEQHRAAIGGNAARQLSRGWTPSTGVFKPSTGIFKPFTTTGQNRRKPQSKAKSTTSLVTEVILLGFMFSLLTMACPLVQRVVGYVLCDHGSLQMTGYLDSEVMVLRPCSDSGTQELLKGCWVHQSTERVILDHLSEDPVIAHVNNRAVVHVCDLQGCVGVS